MTGAIHFGKSRPAARNIATNLPAPPSLIVFSRLAGKYRSAKLLDLGGFGGLRTPFEPEEVLPIAFASLAPLGVRFCCELR